MSLHNHNFRKESGQSLIEILIVLVVGSIMLTGLSVMVISSLRNAQYAQNQIKATKYAQEAIDKIRAIRDWNQEGSVILNEQGSTLSSFESLWQEKLYDAPLCGSDPGRYFTFKEGSDPNIILEEIACASSKDVDLADKGLSRQIFITDSNLTYSQEKKIIVRVSWIDAAGRHDSNLQTLLAPLTQ